MIQTQVRLSQNTRTFGLKRKYVFSQTSLCFLRKWKWCLKVVVKGFWNAHLQGNGLMLCVKTYCIDCCVGICNALTSTVFSFKASTFREVPESCLRSTGVLPKKYWSPAKEVLKGWLMVKWKSRVLISRKKSKGLILSNFSCNFVIVFII